MEVSATRKTGLDKLLEMLSLQAELLELKADPGSRARGVVLEACLDKGRGPVATVLVEEGTLRRGDIVVMGTHWGRVRALLDENAKTLKEAPPACPVQVIGISAPKDTIPHGEILLADNACTDVSECTMFMSTRNPDCVSDGLCGVSFCAAPCDENGRCELVSRKDKVYTRFQQLRVDLAAELQVHDAILHERAVQRSAPAG